MANVFALDLSLTGTGWAGAEHGGPPKWGTFSPPKGLDEMSRLGWILKRVTAVAIDADLIVMEGFSYGSKGGALFQIAGLGYLVRYWLWQNKKPFVAISPMSLKKFVCGRAGGNDPATGEKAPVTKELMIREVYKRWGHDVSDNNQSDALAALYLGMALTGDWKPTVSFQQSIITAVRAESKTTLDALAAPNA